MPRKGGTMPLSARLRISLARQNNNPGGFKKGNTINCGKKRKHSEETKRKIGLAHTGSLHYNWQGGLNIPYKRRAKYTPIILQRDNHICQICGDTGKQIHHIDYNRRNDDLHNLILLCLDCHLKTSREKREYWQWQLKLFMDLWHPLEIKDAVL